MEGKRQEMRGGVDAGQHHVFELVRRLAWGAEGAVVLGQGQEPRPVRHLVPGRIRLRQVALQPWGKVGQDQINLVLQGQKPSHHAVAHPSR